MKIGETIRVVISHWKKKKNHKPMVQVVYKTFRGKSLGFSSKTVHESI